ncbi:inosine triphosphate pyrophosphatase-like protein [Dunaliella salina]|uniref:Inosine triphosphate pyrophosphatase-like protein n=1 Tax=Dunaliella salina TaxID=3046 RepID=A0ABQ7GBJ5_DUNSA|nr:inosine triphosphate pyrophosphatase-like protein [Dunaliella salina]|eukprot:KAF5831991.1 inosine triphosphate pyrophosphatase-like protein [Dunaliella salina]
MQFMTFLATHKPRIILGTRSSSRQLLMRQLMQGYAYETRTADIDEKAIRCEKPGDLVMALAHAKADAIKGKMAATGEDYKTGYLLTCDQVVTHEGRILEKPESEEEARAWLRGYGRTPPGTVGSIVITNLGTGAKFQELDITRIHFKPIPDPVIDEIIKAGDWTDCAGGLRIEQPILEPYLSGIEGSEDSVMGLSKVLTVRLLMQAAGVPV